MKTVFIEGELRTQIGKKHARQIRTKLQKVPAVIYGGKEVISFSAPLSAFKPIIYTSDFVIVEIKIVDKTYRCILKDSQYDKISDELIHADFQELVDGTKVTVNLPIHFEGISEGVKKGGKFLQKLKQLKIKALPKNLKEKIVVNIDNLDLEQNIRVEDIKEEGLEILNSPRIPIASVTLTRVLKQEDTTTSEMEETKEAKEAKDKAIPEVTK